MAGTMTYMSDKRKPDRHRMKQTQIRLHASLRRGLELLAERNVTDVSEEIRAAIRDRLKANDLWPPPAATDDEE